VYKHGVLERSMPDEEIAVLAARLDAKPLDT